MRCNDYELLYMFNLGSQDALELLLREYRTLIIVEVNNIIKQYNRLIIYREDIEQELYICFLDAIATYRDDLNCTFRTYVTKFLQRKIWALLRHYSKGSESMHLNLFI